MTIYYCVFALSFLLCAFDFIGSNKNKLFIYSSFVIAITAMVGFRSIGVDNDSSMYQELFENCNKYSYLQILCGDSVFNREIGYVLLNKIVFVLGFDFRSILLFMSISSAVLTYSFIYKFSPYPFFSLLFYLSFFYLYRDFTQIRYGLCCGLLFWAIFFYCNKKYILFSFFWLLALLFHKTAFILFIILPFLTSNNNKKFYFLFPIVCSVGIYFNVSSLFSFLESYDRVFAYYYNEKLGAGLMLSVLGYIIMLLYHYLKMDLDKESNYNFYFKLLSLGVSLNLLFFQFSVFQRFDYLFFQFSIILLPILLQQLNKQNRNYFRIAYFSFAFCFFVYGCSLINVSLIRPYTFDISLVD